MKKLSNTEAELKKSVAYKKRVYFNLVYFVVGVLDMNTINTNHPSHNQI